MVKSVAIICVVAGHCIQHGSGSGFFKKQLFFDDPVFKAIYGFHMPLFMLVSGYLFAFSIRRHKGLRIIIQKLRTLVLPILIWTLIPFVLSLPGAFDRFGTVSLPALGKRYMYAALENLWFLWAVFWCSAAVAAVNRFFGDSIGVYVAGLVLTFVLPDTLNMHLYKFMYPYFVIGYFFNRYGLAEYYKPVYSSGALLLGSGAAYALLMMRYSQSTYIYISGYSIMKENMLEMLGMDIYRFAVGLAGSVFVMLLVRWGYERVPAVEESNAMLAVGRNTKEIYIISQLIFSYVLPKLTHSLPTVHYSVVGAETVAVIAASMAVAFLIKKSDLLSRCLFGK